MEIGRTIAKTRIEGSLPKQWSELFLPLCTVDRAACSIDGLPGACKSQCSSAGSSSIWPLFSIALLSFFYKDSLISFLPLKSIRYYKESNFDLLNWNRTNTRC
jgi:hypothetical protein